MSFPPASPRLTALPRLLLLAAALAAPGCAPSAGSTAQDAWRSAAIERWGTESFEVLELRLPEAIEQALAAGEVPHNAPAQLRVPLTIDGYPTTLQLVQHSLRTTDFAAQTWSEAGYAPATELAAPLTYRGTAAGMPDLTVLATPRVVTIRERLTVHQKKD